MSEFDFSHLNELAVVGKTSEYSIEVPGLDPSPVLIGRIAGEDNAPFSNTRLKAHIPIGKKYKKAKGGIAGQKEMKEVRDLDCELYAKYVITGWRNIKDSSGEDVPFSKEACLQFFSSLPEWIFDGVRGHFMLPENFLPEPVLDDDDADELGNS